MASTGIVVGCEVLVAEGAGVGDSSGVEVIVGGTGVDCGVATGNCVRGAQDEQRTINRQTNPAILASITSPRLVGRNKQMTLYGNRTGFQWGLASRRKIRLIFLINMVHANSLIDSSLKNPAPQRSHTCPGGRCQGSFLFFFALSACLAVKSSCLT